MKASLNRLANITISSSKSVSSKGSFRRKFVSDETSAAAFIRFSTSAPLACLQEIDG